jgi:hypothetical protein
MPVGKGRIAPGITGETDDATLHDDETVSARDVTQILVRYQVSLAPM